MRNALFGTALLGTVLCAGLAGAQPKTIYIAGYGGSYETTMREQVFPAFEREANVKVEYIAGNSTDNLARMIAQRSNQRIDAVVMDDGPMYQAIALGLCRETEAAPILSELYDVAKVPGGKAIGLGVVATGLVYNREAFQKQGWAPPASWADLADPKFKGKLVVPPLNNTYGVHALIMEAEINSGGTRAIDPGFTAFKQRIGPNVLAYEPSPGKMTELFQSGQAVIAVWGSARAKSLAATGFPMEFVYPKEGAVALGILGCAVAGQRNPPEAQAYLRFMLKPEVQTILARDYGYGPVNRNVTLPPEEAKNIPYGPEAMAKLRTVDWDYVNPKREEWNRRWTREVER
jgi:putative spermidine/putrescine transport system substrate-binding protein